MTWMCLSLSLFRSERKKKSCLASSQKCCCCCRQSPNTQAKPGDVTGGSATHHLGSEHHPQTADRRPTFRTPTSHQSCQRQYFLSTCLSTSFSSSHILASL